MTPGAVSHQIKALEAEIGTPLFLRQHRGVVLTQEGEALARVLAASFGQISRQVSILRKDTATGSVVVGSTTAVAALWLSPAIIEFWRENPDVNVNQTSQDRPFDQVLEFDFIITYGRLGNNNLSQTPIYRDALVAVAAPGVAESLSGCGLGDLAAQRLIHLDAKSRSWTRWDEWFQGLGYRGEVAKGTRVTSYSLALQIAAQGAGVALGWRRLIQPMIESGALAVVGEHILPAPHQFYLAGPHDEDLSENAMRLKNWIRASAQQE